MRRVGKDHNYTSQVMSKRALEVAEQELKCMSKWLEVQGLNNNKDIGQYIHERLSILSNMIEQRFYSIEELRRDNEPDHYQLKSPKGVKVTDHATVRYLQRVMGIDLPELAREIVPDRLEASIKNLRSGRVSQGDTVLVFKDGVVITVLKKSMAKTHRMKYIDIRKKVKRKPCAKRSKKRRYGQ